MSLIPDEYLHPKGGINFAPMVDFLFLTLTVFATLAFSRSALSEMSLETAPKREEQRETPSSGITLSILGEGGYSLKKGKELLPISSIKALKETLTSQGKKGQAVFLHIDNSAKWDAILPVIVAVEEAGLTPYPIN